MTDYELINLAQLESERDPFTEDRYRQFAWFMPSDTLNVLDVGCNTGRGGAVLKKMRPKIRLAGLDCVKDRLSRLPPIYDAVYEGFSTAIPAEQEAFDVIVAGEFIEHLAPHDVDATLHEFFRTLKIGGCLMLTTPNPLGLMFRIRKTRVLGGGHLSQHHNDCLRLRLRMTGFQRVKTYGSGKSSRYLGMHFPLLFLYGSYMLVATK